MKGRKDPRGVFLHVVDSINNIWLWILLLCNKMVRCEDE